VVPVVDLSRRGRILAEPFAEAARRIAASGRVLLGDETAAFEASFARWLDVRDAVTVSSGAAALQLALTALGVGPGDEVVVPAFTAVPTAPAVLAAGATPVLADVDPSTACIDTARVEQARSSRSRAVVVVHLYGFPAAPLDMDLLVVDDAAQAHGALHQTRPSAASAYSFYPTKNLGGIGDGGAVVSSDPAVTAAVRQLRVHGMTEQYRHEQISQNFRMSEIEAAWLSLALATLSADNDRRRTIAAHYRSSAPQLRWQRDHPDHVHHLAVFRAADRGSAQDLLAELGVATAVHYPLALTQQPAFAGIFAAPCPVAEAWARECVTVPCFPELTDAEVDHVAIALAKVPA
jgi:dTDP-4-amino-4,6-dideoxygalactose transaminase